MADADQHELVTIIVPCFNEADNIQSTVEVLLALQERTDYAFQIVLVNDGSTDQTGERGKELAEKHAQIIFIDLLRNFGQSQAYQAGLDAAEGKYVVFYSADRDAPAEAILEVIAKLDDGYDFVNTARMANGKSARSWKSRLANRILNFFSRISIRDRGSGLKGITKVLADRFRLYGEWHRFMPDYASMYTERMTEIDVEHQERKAGKSSYRDSIKSLAVFLDIPTLAFTLFSRRKPFIMLPGRLFGFTGLVLFVVGGAITSYLVFGRVFLGMLLADRPLFLLSIMLTGIGLTMVMLGLLGEMVLQLAMRIGVNGKEGHYVVRAVHGRAPNTDGREHACHQSAEEIAH